VRYPGNSRQNIFSVGALLLTIILLREAQTSLDDYPVSSDFLFVIPAGDLLFPAGPRPQVTARHEIAG
jgi:hypothetical protein